MGNVLKADVEGKLARLPDVKEVNVEIVFEPPWGPARMSEAAKLQFGFDLSARISEGLGRRNADAGRPAETGPQAQEAHVQQGVEEPSG